MSVKLYYTAEDVQRYETEETFNKLTADVAYCELNVCCRPQTVVGLRVGDGPVDNSFIPVVIYDNPYDATCNPLLACEDCAGWIAEASGADIEVVQ